MDCDSRSSSSDDMCAVDLVESVPAPMLAKPTRPWSARTQGSTLADYGVRVRSGARSAMRSETRTFGNNVADDDCWRPGSAVKKWQAALSAPEVDVAKSVGVASQKGPLTSRGVSELLRKYLLRSELHSAPFTTSFKKTLNLDLRMQAESMLSNEADERRLKMSERSKPPARKEGCRGNDVATGVAAAHSVSSETSRTCGFRTAWRVPTNADLRRDAMQTLTLRTFSEPFVVPAERCKLRSTAEEQAAVYARAEADAERHRASSCRPTTPRSVSSFFHCDDATFAAQDHEFAAQFRARVLASSRASSRTQRETPGSTANAACRTPRPPTSTPRPSAPTQRCSSVAAQQKGWRHQMQRTAAATTVVSVEEPEADPRDVAAWVERVSSFNKQRQAADAIR